MREWHDVKGKLEVSSLPSCVTTSEFFHAENKGSSVNLIGEVGHHQMPDRVSSVRGVPKSARPAVWYLCLAPCSGLWRKWGHQSDSIEKNDK
jgi:hypothetical protein